MDINSLLGKKVTHENFGNGVISEISDDRFVNVDFNGVVKKFMIDSLDLFFTFEDKGLEELIKKENQKKREEKAALEAEAKAIEEERRLKEQEEKRLAAEEAPRKAKKAKITAIPSTMSGSCKTITTTTVLQSNNTYGTVAQKIYDSCCAAFGWDKNKRGLFGRQQELYAEDATPEKYSVWFLAHSNWTDTRNGQWSNKIYHKIKHINERWDDITKPRFESDAEIRVVFAKNRDRKYVFLGIYKCLSIDTATKTKIYELIADEYKPQNILSSDRNEMTKGMPLADVVMHTLRDSDCAIFSNNDNKIRVRIKESKSSEKLIRDIYQACGESDPIRVCEGNNYLGEWEVEEYSEDIDQNGVKYHFFQLIPFLHISLIQHQNKLYSSWTVTSKHVVSYQIEDKNIRLDFEENRMKHESVDAVIPVSIYKDLKSLFRSYYDLLNTNSATILEIERSVMERVPYGGVSVTPYTYHIGNKQASYVSPLFVGKTNAAERLNEIIKNIENHI